MKMVNKPKIISNNLDQVTKSGERYGNELNSPKLHSQIIDAFNKNLSGLFDAPVEELQDIDIHKIEASADEEMDSFYEERRKFWERRTGHSSKESRDELDHDNEIRKRYYTILNKRDKRRILNGIPRVTDKYLGNTVGNNFQKLKGVIERDYCRITGNPFNKKLGFHDSFMKFWLNFGMGIDIVRYNDSLSKNIKDIESYIGMYDLKLQKLCLVIQNTLANIKKGPLEVQDIQAKSKECISNLRGYYVEAVLACKLLQEQAKQYNDLDNEKLLQNRLQSLLSKIAELDNMKNSE